VPEKLKTSRSASAFRAIGRGLEDALGHLSKDKAYLVGVSGGRDSMALLHALVAAGFQNLVVCHLDHGLRGKASQSDARLVGKEAGKLGLPVETARAQTDRYAKDHGKSIELAARELRYCFFRECARRRKCPRLLLAHHADDQVETCFFQFLRGSGAPGLAGMRASSKSGGLQILRPFLNVSRENIDAYVCSKAIAFHEDATNADPNHTRNRIRHEVLPTIEKSFGPSFRAAILRASEILRHENDWIESQVPELPPAFSCAAVRVLHPALQLRAVHQWLRRNGAPEPGLRETRRVLALLDVKNGPAKISLPGKTHARRRAGQIFIEGEEAGAQTLRERGK